LSIISKGTLIRRDIDLLAQISKVTALHVLVSAPFMDKDMCLKMEPGAPSPAARMETMRLLSQAGIATGIMIGPIIPGLNESQIPDLLHAAHRAGARTAARNLLRLPAELKDVFLHSLAERFPSHAKKVTHHILESRQGKLNNSEFGQRFQGHGQHWKMAQQLFNLTCRKLGMNQRPNQGTQVYAANTFQRPGQQLALF
jgi:DNA repair photolyase